MAFSFWRTPLIVNVYIDGFNFYYGVYKRPAPVPWKWLDYRLLSEHLARTHVAAEAEVRRVRYFTAEVQPSDTDPTVHVRQQTLLFAIAAHSGVEVEFGRYLLRKLLHGRMVRHPIHPPAVVQQWPADERERFVEALAAIRRVSVFDHEEKGSDVNLASRLLVDTFRAEMDAAIVVSNDSDFKLPITLVRETFGLPIIVVNPSHRPTAQDLVDTGAVCVRLDIEQLEHFRMPNAVVAGSVAVHVPEVWEQQEERFRARRLKKQRYGGEHRASDDS